MSLLMDMKKIEAELAKSDKFVNDLKQILEESVPSNTEFPDDIYILFSQLTHIEEVKEEYKLLVIRDLKAILSEISNPTQDPSFIQMDDDELEEANHLYRHAVNGYEDAQVELGHLYRMIGREDWAFPWFEASANAGNPEALYWLGNYYYMGKVVKQDIEKTYYSYKESAEKGFPDAMNNYADMYLRGEFVEKNPKRALELFRKAADNGVPEAMYTLGYMYENGVGTDVDLQKSKEWFKESALAGDVFAANKLGHEAVENGLGEEAISWYKMAADRGDSYGEFNLGMCYENGIGTPVNMKKAKIWYQKAALKGDVQAKEKLKEI